MTPNTAVKFYQMIVPQSVAATTALPTGAAITAQTYGTTLDTAGYSYLQVAVCIGALSSSGGQFSTLQMAESDTTANFSSYPAQGSSAVTTGIFGTSSTLSLTTYSNSAEGSYYTPTLSWLPSTANSVELLNIDLKGRKRYQQLQWTTGPSGSTLVSALAILSRAEVSPKTATQYGVDQVLQVPGIAY